MPGRDPLMHPRQPLRFSPEPPRAPLGGGLPLPAGGLGFSVLRSMGTLGTVRGRSLGDILNDPIDGVAKLVFGTVVRAACGRALTRATHGVGLSGAAQRALIFAGESVAEGAFYYWYEKTMKGRKPRAAAGYLRADWDELLEALAAVGLSAAGFSWAGRESSSAVVTLQAGAQALCYGTLEKIQRIAKAGLASGAYLTPNLEMGKARVCELLALPSVAEAVATITFLRPVNVIVRRIATDFGRLGGGIELITKDAVPSQAMSVGAAITLLEDAGTWD